MGDFHSLTNFLKLIDEFGQLSGLKVNFEKSEIMPLGNQYSLTVDKHEVKNFKVKKAVQIIGCIFHMIIVLILMRYLTLLKKS